MYLGQQQKIRVFHITWNFKIGIFFFPFFFEIFLCNIIIFFYYYLLIKVLGSVNLGISGRVGRVTGNTYFFGLINIYLFEAYAL